MSVVTDIILIEFDSVGTLNCPPPMVKINDWLNEEYRCSLQKVDQMAGGNKFTQVGVWMAAINHFASLYDFVEVVRNAGWEWPEYVRLMVNEEFDDEGFKTVFGAIR